MRPGSGSPSPDWNAPRADESVRPALAAVLARLGQPAEAWQALEEDLGRGLLDELAARQDRRLAPAERARLRELTTELERLDKLVETTPQGLDQAERAKRFEDLKRQRELASIALGEFQTKLVGDHGPLAGQVARLNEIQAALPADAALVAWVDLPPAGPNAADPDGEHWGVVVRSRGTPAWVPIAGTGPDGLWTKDDTALANRVRTELRRRPGGGPANLHPLIEELRTQRLEPLAKALASTTDGLPTARKLIVLPSRAMAGIPVEALLAPDDTRTVSYAPSATVFKYLRAQPRPDRHAGLLALGDPVYEHPDSSSEPKPLPDHGLLVNVVTPGSNAATHGLKPGDVLLAYNGQVLNTKDDLKVVAEGDKPVAVEVWRDGQSSRRDLATGKLGVVLDPRPAPVAIAEQRKLRKMLVAARSGDEDFAPLPGTRYEVEALARLFKSDDRPTRTLLGADASEPELDRLAAVGRAGPVRLHPPGDPRGDRRRSSGPLGGDPDPDGLARPARAGPEPPAGLRRPALGPRDPARLGPEGRAGDALGVRDGPGPRRRRRGVRGVHPGALDVGHAQRLPVALEGGRHGDGSLDAAFLRQPAGRPSRVVAATAQGGGVGRGEAVAARVASRGSDGAGGEAVGRRGAGRGGDAAEAGAAGPRCAGGGGRRPALCPALLLGRVRTGRRSGLIPLNEERANKGQRTKGRVAPGEQSSGATRPRTLTKQLGMVSSELTRARIQPGRQRCRIPACRRGTWCRWMPRARPAL